MEIDRPMSEYEAALFDAVLAIGRALLKAGADESVMLAEIKEAENAQRLGGRRNGAATLQHLAKYLCEPTDFYVPGRWPPVTET